MKLLNFTLAACMMSASSFAQLNDSTGYVQYSSLINKTLHKQTANNALKTTGTAERLIRSYDVITKTTFTNNDDSFEFRYSGSKGSKFDFNEMVYHPLIDIRSDFMNQADYSHPDIMADSVYQHQLNIGLGTLFLKEIQENSYNNFGFVEDCKQYVIIQASSNIRTQIFYNAQFLADKVKMYIWDVNSNQWVENGLRKIKYDALGKVLTDSAFILNGSNGYDAVNAYRYEYDNNGNMTKVMQNAVFSNNTWHDVKEFLFTYYSGNQLKTSSYSSNPTQAGWSLVARDSFGYQAGVDFYTSRFQGVTFFDHGEYKHLNSQNLPDSISYVGIQNGVPTEKKKRIVTYNANNNPILSVYYDYTAPTLIDRKTHYVYETYDPLKINDVSSEDISVYPNPAHDVLHITLKQEMLHEQIQIKLVNSLGAVVFTNSFIPQTRIVTLNINRYTPGIYFLALISRTGNHCFTINKL